MSGFFYASQYRLGLSGETRQIRAPVSARENGKGNEPHADRFPGSFQAFALRGKGEGVRVCKKGNELSHEVTELKAM